MSPMRMGTWMCALALFGLACGGDDGPGGNLCELPRSWGREGIERQIAMADAETACVQDARRNCRCAIRRVNVIDDGDGYAIEGNQIVSATLMKRWDYCVSGAELRYRDVSASGEREPGIIELGRR